MVGLLCKVGQPDALQHNEMTTQKQKNASGSKEFCYVHLEAASLEDGKHTTLRERSLSSAFSRNSQSTKGKTMQKLIRTS